MALVGVAAVGLSGLTGCSNSSCTDNQSALPLMGFYDYATGNSVTINSINFGGVGAPGDSLLIQSGESNSQVYLPFRANASSTAFYFNYQLTDNEAYNALYNDTITFYYTASPYFASNECGAMYQYRINRVVSTYHLIDSIAVVDSLITNVELERIKVFFRTSSDTDDTDNSASGDDSEESNPEEGDEA